MATTNYLFSLMKFIGNTAYAYGPVQQYDDGDYSIERDDKATLQESANFTSWQFYNILSDEVYNDGFNTTDVLNAGENTITDSGYSLTKDNGEFTYNRNFIIPIFNRYDSSDDPTLYYHLIKETETVSYFMRSPYALSARGEKLNANNSIYGSGSADETQYPSSTNMNSVSFIKVDKNNGDNYIPISLGFSPRLEITHSTENFTIRSYYVNGSMEYTLSFDQNDKLLSTSYPYGDYFYGFTNAYKYAMLHEYDDKFIIFDYSGQGTLFDSTMSVAGVVTYTDVNGMGRFLGAYTNEAKLNVIYTDSATQNDIIIATQDVNDTWLHVINTGANNNNYFNEASLVVGEDKFYLQSGDRYFYCTKIDNFNNFTEITEDLYKLLYANNLYIGYYENTIRYSTDGISFSSYEGETDPSYSIVQMLSSNNIIYILSRDFSYNYKIYKSVDGSSLELILDTLAENIPYVSMPSLPFSAAKDGILFFNGRYNGTTWDDFNVREKAFRSTNTQLVDNGVIISLPNIIQSNINRKFYTIDLELESNAVLEHDAPEFQLYDIVDGQNNVVNMYFNDIINDGEKYVWLLVYTTGELETPSGFGDLHIEIRSKNNILNDEELWTYVTVNNESDLFGNNFLNMLAITEQTTHRSFHYNGKIYFLLLNNIIAASHDLVDWFDLDLYSTDNFITTTPIRVSNIVRSQSLFTDQFLQINSDNDFYTTPVDYSTATKFVSNTSHLFTGAGAFETADITPSLPLGGDDGGFKIANITPPLLLDVQYDYYEVYNVNGTLHVILTRTTETERTLSINSLNGSQLVEIGTQTVPIDTWVNIETFLNNYFVSLDFSEIRILDTLTGDAKAIAIDGIEFNPTTSYVQSSTHNPLLNTLDFIIYDYMAGMYYPMTVDIDSQTVTNGEAIAEVQEYDYYETIYNSTENTLNIVYNTYDKNNDITTYYLRKTINGTDWTETEITDSNIIDYEEIFYNQYIDKFIIAKTENNSITLYSSSDCLTWELLYEMVIDVNINQFPQQITDNGNTLYLAEEQGIDYYSDISGGRGQYILIRGLARARYETLDHNDGTSYKLSKYAHSNNYVTFIELNDFVSEGTLPADAVLFSTLTAPEGYHKPDNVLVSAAVTNKDISTTIIGISDHKPSVISYAGGT